MRIRCLQRFHVLAALMAVTAMVGLSGCAVTPLNGTQYASMDSTITVTGFTQEPNQHIHVLVDPPFPNYPGGIVGETQTGTTPVFAHGSNWYMYSVKIKLKDHHWGWAQDGRRRAVLRCKKFNSTNWQDMDNGTPLFTFNSWAYEPDKSLLDFWNDHGHGTTIEIFAPDN